MPMCKFMVDARLTCSAIQAKKASSGGSRPQNHSPGSAAKAMYPARSTGPVPVSYMAQYVTARST